MPRRLPLLLAPLTIALLPAARTARAIIVLGGTGRLAAPPSGEYAHYADSGTQYIGTWGGFCGTAIGPHHFVSAAHIRSGAGDVFTIDGKEYSVEACNVVAGTDLAVWRVRGTLPRWAAL